MDFSAALEGFFTVPSLVFMVVIYFIVGVFKKICEEGLAPQLDKLTSARHQNIDDWIKMIWTKWILPAAPYVVACGFAWLIGSFPYPAPFNESLAGRVCYGLVAGGCSSYVYRALRGVLKTALKKVAGDKAELLDKVDGGVKEEE